MEVMEEGNIMDRVLILLQRDMAYYQERQTVLTEKICPGVAGGPLDFPRHTSFAAYKVVTWWEEAYTVAFGHSSGLLASDAAKVARTAPSPPPPSTKASTPSTSALQKRSDFVELVSNCTNEFLEHLHALSQEALDHADLGVLSATLGASALLRSCLWCYQRLLPAVAENAASASANSLVTPHHKMHELVEALAERLLDLHCRLLSLYVLQESYSLDWESTNAFSEGERGSFTIQMWWLYMQGMRQDLWTSIPPATAQRVLAGVLNESLTILVARYWHARASMARATQLAGDVSNLLQCVYALLPALSNDASEMVGFNMSDASLRDLHSKCRRLLAILIIRGAPLRPLHAAFRRGLDSAAAVRKLSELRQLTQLVGASGESSPSHSHTEPTLTSAWRAHTSELELATTDLVNANTDFLFLLQPNRNLLRSEKGAQEPWLKCAGGASSNRSDADAVAIEMAVLLAQPQPNWPLLVRVLVMRNYLLSKAILKMLMVDEHEATVKEDRDDSTSKGCGLFLCAGDCDCGVDFASGSWRNILEKSLVLILAAAGGGAALISALQPVLTASAISWGTAMDRSHLWSPQRPAWLAALLRPLAPIVKPAVDVILAAAASGTPNCDLPSLTIRCLIHLAPCVPAWATTAASAITDASPADVRPAGGTSMTHLLLAALYDALMQVTELSPSLIAVGEALMDVDASEMLQPLLATLRRTLDDMSPPVVVCGITSPSSFEDSAIANELGVGRVTATSEGRRALAILLRFLRIKGTSFLPTNGASTESTATAAKACGPAKLLKAMFYIGDKHFDQLLAGSWQPDWSELLQEPLGLSRLELWKQLQLRPEFRAGACLDKHDSAVVEAVEGLFADCRGQVVDATGFSDSDDTDAESDFGASATPATPQPPPKEIPKSHE